MPVAWAPPSVLPAPLPAGFPEIQHRDADLPVRFTGNDLKFVERLPFLPWRPELVAAGAAPTFQDVAAVEMAAVIASLLDFSRLPADFMVEAATFKAARLGRLLRALWLYGSLDEAYADEASFLADALVAAQAVREQKLNFIWVQPSDFVSVEALGPGYQRGARWIAQVPYRAAQTPQQKDALVLLLRCVGPRYSSARANVAARFSTVATVIGGAHLATYPAEVQASLTPSVLGGQFLSWFATLKYPVPLRSTPREEQEALDVILRLVRYERSSPADRSGMLEEVFDRVLLCCPTLQMVTGKAAPSEACKALKPLFQELSMTSSPDLEDYRLLDARLSQGPTPLVGLLDGMADSAKQVHARVQVLVADLEKSGRKRKGVSEVRSEISVEDLPTGARAIPTSCSAASLESLRRDPKANKLVQELEQLHQKRVTDEVDDNTLFKLLMTCQIAAVVRWTVGGLTKLEEFDIFGELSQFRCNHLRAKELTRLGIYLGFSVTHHLHGQYPILETFAFSGAFVLALLSSPWANIDFEQRLVHDVEQWRLGNQDEVRASPNYSRPRSQWYTNKDTLEDLVEPITLLFMALGYHTEHKLEKTAAADNSVAAVVHKVIEGLKFAKKNPYSARVRQNAVKLMFDALDHAHEKWSSFFGGDNAMAPFPRHWLPLQSKAANALDKSTRSADKALELEVDLGIQFASKQEQTEERHSVKRGVVDLDPSPEGEPREEERERKRQRNREKKTKAKEKKRKSQSEFSAPSAGDLLSLSHPDSHTPVESGLLSRCDL